ncbi:MAG: sulfatase [Cyclobacteriaceae bacterium]|nr:sulfatase [Cyclobacteriaceae bacterium]
MKLVVSTIAFVILCFNAWCQNETPALPNILFIVTDDLGIRDLGCYGSDYYLTPNLDQLASQSMRFTRAYSASHVCSPTRATIFTGKYPHRVRITDALPWDRLSENPKLIPPDHLKELPSDLPMFSKSLQSAGYRTALFGKWHLGNEYQFFTEEGHYAYGFDEAFPSSGSERRRDKCVDDLTARTIAFLESNRERPFMLCLMHHTPHVPLACPPKDEALYDDVPKGRFQKNQKYAGMISHLDQSIKLILERLEALELDENTVVIFTSDNGGLKEVTSNKPYRGSKGNYYEGGIRVPLIVRWPGQISPATVSNAAVHSADYFPSFLALAGLNPIPEAHQDGVNMLPIWRGKNAESRTFYWHFPHRSNPASAVISGDWKLVHHIVTNKYELFDLKTDPEEKSNLISVYSDKFQLLKSMLEEHLQHSGAQRMRPNPDWDSSLPPGKIKNYGTHYPTQGGTYRQVEQAYPVWFKEK